jgi:hypothetical protein
MIDNLTTGHGFLYDDAFEIENGYLYKVVGDLHPRWGVISLLEYVPWEGGRRFGFEKTFDFSIPSLNQRVTPVFPLWFIALYGRAFEVVPLEHIKRRFQPEQAAENVASEQTPKARAVNELLEAFSKASGVSREKIGLNGSWMLGLANDDSNINIDIIGAEASAQAMRFLADLGRFGARSGFYPPGALPGRNSDALTGLLKDAFPGLDETEGYRLLGNEGRLRFSAFYLNRPFTIQIHCCPRDGPLRVFPHEGGRVIRRTLVEADITNETGLLSYHSPCTIGLDHVTDLLLGTKLNVKQVTSWSKRFWYTRPGDRVRFLADLIELNDELRLAVPAFGGNFIFTFKHRSSEI